MHLTLTLSAARREHGLPDRLLHLRHPLLAITCESLDALEYRLRIQLRFGDDIRFQATAKPDIVLVSRQRVTVSQRTGIPQRPHALRAGRHEHHVVVSLSR